MNLSIESRKRGKPDKPFGEFDFGLGDPGVFLHGNLEDALYFRAASRHLDALERSQSAKFA